MDKEPIIKLLIVLSLMAHSGLAGKHDEHAKPPDHVPHTTYMMDSGRGTGTAFTSAAGSIISFSVSPSAEDTVEESGE